jgi:tetratricopeptide (TPR) repeat protein
MGGVNAPKSDNMPSTQHHARDTPPNRDPNGPPVPDPADIIAKALTLRGIDREDYLDAACADDPALRARIAAHLARLESPTAEEPPRAPRRTADLGPGDTIANFTIISKLGEGGMGVVYRAAQAKPEREVALKVIRPTHASPRALRRFEHESEILGRLHHPGIAQVYEAGVDPASGCPYFAMELVEGQPLASYAWTRRLDLQAKLQLFSKVCMAVQHAHAKGVIHRDLKPANILVDLDGNPKVLDFGVARLTDDSRVANSVLTDMGQLVGTVPYMSPEQAGGVPDDLDTRSDVYALGVILYELLTGRLPYDIEQKLVHEAVRIIREDDPIRLSRINTSFRGDIETIVAKALEKERDRRYQSPLDIATDIERYLGDEPITARPASVIYQLRKFTRRHRALVGAAAFAVVLVASAAAVSTFYAIRATKAERRTAQSLARANELNRFLIDDIIAAGNPELNATTSTPSLLLLDAVLNASRQSWSRSFSDPSTEASIHSVLGQTLLSLSALEPAERHLRHAISLRSASEDPEALRLDLENLGELLLRSNRTSEAVTTLSTAFNLLTPDVATPSRAYTTMQLANALKHDGQVDAAATAYAQALTLTPNTPESALLRLKIRYNQALLTAASDATAARDAMRQVHTERVAILGSDHLETLYAQKELATLEDRSGNAPEAETGYRAVLPMLEARLTPDHFRVRETAVNLASLLRRTGRAPEAVPMLWESLDWYRAAPGFGPSHPQTAQVARITARALGESNRTPEAHAVLDQCLADLAAAPDPGPFDLTLQTRLDLTPEPDRPAVLTRWRPRPEP